MPYTISVDTGGTFTDVVISDPTDKLTIGKALTTRDRIFLGVHEAIQAAADEINVTLSALLSQTKLLIYGTTRATNAIVTKTVAKTAFVTTEGFADILVLKEGGKFNPHDFSKDYSDPYVPRRYTYEIPERMSAEGTISVPFQESRAREVAQVLKAKGFEAVAVCFLWSIANPEHEIRMARLLDEILPSTPYTLSHQLIPIVREYRRASATAIDASLKPLMQQHLRELETDLRQAGFSGEVLVSTTAGGCAAIEALVEKPIYTVGSGPAMAPIAGLTSLGWRVWVTISSSATPAAQRSTWVSSATDISPIPAKPGSASNTPETFWASQPSTCAQSALAADRSHGSTMAALCALARSRQARIPDRPATAAAASSQPSPTRLACLAISILSFFSADA
jgi:N-methylhydantoinase A